jgi:predicted membrane protein
MRYKNRFWSYLIGGLFVIFGSLVLLHNLDIIHLRNIWSIFWPTILILIGIIIVLKRSPFVYYHTDFQKEKIDTEKKEGTADDKRDRDDKFNQSNVFGDVKFAGTYHDFPGSNISNIFGDIMIDLSDIDFPEGERNVSINGIFGSISIILPKDIASKFSGSTIAGSIKFIDEKKDGLLINLDSKTDNYEIATKKLKIRASLIFGDINVH